MQIRERLEGDVAIIQLDGRLTITDHPGQVKDVIATATSRGAKHVLLDLSGVQYLDSTRLGELIAAHVSVSRRGGRLTLVAVPARVVELLTLAGLGAIFERFESAEAALASLGEHGPHGR